MKKRNNSFFVLLGIFIPVIFIFGASGLELALNFVDNPSPPPSSEITLPPTTWNPEQEMQNIIGSVSGEVVPVLDQAILNVSLQILRTLKLIGASLDSLDVITSREFQQLNMRTFQVLDKQVEDKMNDIFVDSFKESSYLEYRAELEKIIDQNRVRDPDQRFPGDYKSYNDYLEEARQAGIILALKDFKERIPCFNPRIRFQVTSYIVSLLQDVPLNLTASKILEDIPDCVATPFSEVASLKEPLVVRLIKPFGFGLFAQVKESTTENSEIPPIVITPQIEETQDAIETNNLKFIINEWISNRKERKETERKMVLGEIKPIETCLQYDFLDDGTAVCLEYKTIINLADLDKSLRSNVLANSSLLTTLESPNIFEIFTNPHNLFVKLGVVTTTLTSQKELLGIFQDEQALKDSIDQLCKEYIIDQRLDVIFVNYTECLRNFANSLSHLADIEIVKIDSIGNLALTTMNEFRVLQQQTEALKNQTSPICGGSYEDLENISGELQNKINDYTLLLNQIRQQRVKLTDIQALIRQAINLILEILEKIRYIRFSVLNVIEQFLKHIVNVKDLPLIPTLLKELANIEGEGSDLVREIIVALDNILTLEAQIVISFNNYYFTLYQNDISRTKILNDIYQNNEIRQKLEEYGRIIAQEGCLVSQALEGTEVLASQPQKITVESKNTENQNQKFSWLKNLIKSLIDSKLVEIRFER